MKTQQKQKGQGSIEFIVASIFVLIPLFFGISYLGKMSDARHNNIEASRYALWEKTVWADDEKDSAQISNEISRRVFGLQGTALNSTKDKAKVETVELDGNLSIYESGKDYQMLENLSDDLASYATATNEDPKLGLSSAVMDLAGAGLGLDQSGLHTLSVTRQLYLSKRLDDIWKEVIPGDDKKLQVTDVNAMLIGAWNAKSPESVRDTVSKAVPFDFLDNPAFQSLQTVIGLLFPDLNGLEPGIVQPDIVPCQRVKGRTRGAQCE